MLTIFRKLRRKELKTGRYLKYALGEILLVVVGILIALQINLWSQKSKDSAKEQLILKSLLLEIESNLTRLDSSISTNTKNRKAAEEMANLIGTKESDLREVHFARLFGLSFKHEISYSPGLGVLNEIINTGNLSLIKKDEIRSMISSWEARLQRVHYQQAQTEKVRQKIYDLMMARGNFRKLLDVTREDEPWYQLKEGSFSHSNLSLLKDREFENNLVLFIGTSAYLDFSFYHTHREELKKFKSLINDNIKEK